MLTFFTTGKSFKGHIAIIQRNALQSWKKLHPDVEILVFGDDEGSAEVCAELGLRHEPKVARTKGGAIRLDDMFGKAQALAAHDVLCYVNCDIILMSDFWRAISQTRTVYPQFLMVGRRWDTEISEPVDFSSRKWEEQIRDRALAARHQRDAWWIDYFAFRRGLFGPDVPPFALGRTSWDNWLVWKGCRSGYPVVDATPSVTAVHQNHDYGHHPQGMKGVWKGEEAQRNFQLAGGCDHMRTIDDAALVLKDGAFRTNPSRYRAALSRSWREAKRILTYQVLLPLWHAVLGATRPLRHLFGLRS
jgi:hypothetical protein